MTDKELIDKLRRFIDQDRSGDSGDWVDAFDLMDEAAKRLEELSKLTFPHLWA